jgi:GTPase SAR1 family protein
MWAKFALLRRVNSILCSLTFSHSPFCNILFVDILSAEGVGKSSLISTFVSRHFSEVVPGIMTRVRLPPDPENSCITTIVDSQGGDAALMSAVATMSVAGGVPIAGIMEGGSTARRQTVLGTTSSSAATIGAGPSARMETLPSLRTFSTSANPSGMGGIENVDSIILIYDLDRDETFFRLENHWLPLIERCYNGNVS